MFRQKKLLRKCLLARSIKLGNRSFSSETNLPKQADVVVVGKFSQSFNS